jgi:serine/threonine-protein kinase HipA
MQLSLGRFDISRAAVLADANRFGFASAADATDYLDALLKRISASYDIAAQALDQEWRKVLHERLSHNLAILGSPAVG